MPIAPSHLYNDLRSAENDVVSSARIEHGCMDPVAQSSAMKFLSQCKLRTGVTLPLASHPGQSLGARSFGQSHRVEKR